MPGPRHGEPGAGRGAGRGPPSPLLKQQRPPRGRGVSETQSSPVCDPEQCLLLRPQVDIRQEQCIPLPEPPAPRAEDKGPWRESGAGELGGAGRRLEKAQPGWSLPSWIHRHEETHSPFLPTYDPLGRLGGVDACPPRPREGSPGRRLREQGLRQEHFSLALLNFHQKPCFFWIHLGQTAEFLKRLRTVRELRFPVCPALAPGSTGHGHPLLRTAVATRAVCVCVSVCACVGMHL